MLCALLLTACATPSALVSRNGYWADRSRPSNAYGERIRFVVLHYTSGSAAGAFEDLLGPFVSAHYLILEQLRVVHGKLVVYQLVDEENRAWHAGRSAWRGRRNLNDTSIGIEIVNSGPLTAPGDARTWEPYTDAQIKALVALLRDLIRRYDIPPRNIVGHADVSPDRKIDPGPRFPWQWLAAAGIGAWPDPDRVAWYRQRFADALPDIAVIQAALARYGYAVPITGKLDQHTRNVLRAFQMHFRPAQYDGLPDLETVARLWALNAEYAAAASSE